MAIISMGPSAYYQKLQNEYWNEKEKEQIKRNQSIINAQVEMYKAQAEYYRAKAECIRNANQNK